MDPQFAGKPFGAGGPYSHRADIDQMPETPQRGSHHRRAHSETFFRFPDDLLLDTDIDFNLAAFDLGPDSPSPAATFPSDETKNNITNDGGNVESVPMAVDSFKSEESSADDTRVKRRAPGGHFRSLSVDADFFEGLGFTSSSGAGALGDCGEVEKKAASAAERRGGHHRHSISMDGSTASFDGESSMMMMMMDKKGVGQDRIAELALIDPKRAKRILANRQSAARSKERKVRYTSELERKVQTLQTEATTLSAQVTLLQRDATGLTSENKELKLRLQAMEQQAHLRDALNEALREEVQRLKIESGQISASNGNSFNRGVPQYPRTPYFSGQQTQQQQQQQQQYHQQQQQQQQHQQQLHVAQSSSNNQNPNGNPQRSFLNFNQRT